MENESQWWYEYYKEMETIELLGTPEDPNYGEPEEEKEEWLEPNDGNF
jgi:hypothetical protein